MLLHRPQPHAFKEEEPVGCSTPKGVFERSPEELVDIAVSELQAAGIQLIEWRALVNRRMDVPIVLRASDLSTSSPLICTIAFSITIQYYSYVVPDEDLPRASRILSDIGLPLLPHSELLSKAQGDIHTKATHHRLNRSFQCVPYFALYPASFVSFKPEELYIAAPIHHRSSTSTTRVLVPRPSAVYGWLFRTMLLYPKYCSVRTNLNSTLSELVDYHLLQVQEGFVDPDESPELWEELDMPKRTIDALDVISQWTRNNEWREGEEWFGDALGAIVSNEGNMDYLPCGS